MDKKVNATLLCANSLFWILCVVTGENVLVQTARQWSTSCYPPDQLDTTIKREGKDDLALTLKVNEKVTVPRSVLVMSTDEVSGQTKQQRVQARQTARAYHSEDNEAFFVIKCSKHEETSVHFYILEGLLTLDGVKFKLSPTNTDVTVGPDDVTATYVMEQIQAEENAQDHSFLNRLSDWREADSNLQQSGATHDRRKRSTTYVFDVLPVVDYSLYSMWLNATDGNATAAVSAIGNYLANVFTGVSLRYATIDLENDVALEVQMAGSPLILTDPSDSYFTEDNKVQLDDGTFYVNIMNQISEFKDMVKTNDLSSTRSDHVMLFTGYDHYGNGAYTDTVSDHVGGVYRKQICKEASVSVVKDRMGFRSEHRAALLIAICIAATTDGSDNECEESERYIMSSPKYNGEFTEEQKLNIFTFSNCSIESISEAIKKLENNYPDCLLNSVEEPYGLTKLTPKKLDAQCRTHHGSESYVCRGDDYPLDDFCTRAHCHTGDGPCAYILPATGTCCASGKYCLQGICTQAPGGECEDECPVMTDFPSCVYENIYSCADVNIRNRCCNYCLGVRPPSDPPSVTVNGKPIVNNEEFNIDFEESLDVQCNVNDGYPNVSNVSIECTGMPSTFEHGISAATNFVASEEVAGAKCVCSANHLLGGYTLTTSFTVAINEETPLREPVITVDGDAIPNNGQVYVNLDQSVDVHCSVDGGYPGVSNVTIGCTGMPSTTKEGTSVNKSFVAGEEVDRTQCVCSAKHVSDNYDQTTAFDIRVAGPPKFETSNTPMQKVSSMGLMETIFRVVSHPAVTRFKLAKYRSEGQGQGDQEEEGGSGGQLVKEFHSSEFSVKAEYVDDYLNVVTLNLVELHPDEMDFYTLTLINGIEPPLEASFTLGTLSASDTGREQGPKGQTSASNPVILYILIFVAGLCWVLLIVGLIVYHSTAPPKK